MSITSLENIESVGAVNNSENNNVVDPTSIVRSVSENNISLQTSQNDNTNHIEMEIQSFPMTTDEEGSNDADRRIPLGWPACLHDIVGNFSGIYQAVGIYAHHLCPTPKIFTFNDSSWNDEDKNALFTKRKTGSARDSASINGHGIKLVIDRIVDGRDDNKKLWAIYFVTELDANNNLIGKKCYIGKFKYTNWQDMNQNDITNYKNKKSILGIPASQQTGTLSCIPLNKDWAEKLQKVDKGIKMLEKLRNVSNIFLNRYNFENGGFFWDGMRQNLEKICPVDAIELDVSLYWDTNNKNTSSCNKAYLQINNYDDIKIYFPRVVKRFRVKSIGCWKKIDLTILYEPTSQNPIEKENFILRYAIITKKESEKQRTLCPTKNESDLEGIMVYYKNRCLTLKTLKNGMGGKISGGAGAIGDRYNGKMRFEIELKTPDSMLFYMPSDKTNIKPNQDGLKILKFFKFLAELHDHRVKNKNNYGQNLPPLPPLPIPPRPHISNIIKFELWDQQFGNVLEVKCKCGQTMRPCFVSNPKANLCHIKAHNNGGSIEPENLYWACHRCNGNTEKDFLFEIAERYGRNSNKYLEFRQDFIDFEKIYEEPPEN